MRERRMSDSTSFSPQTQHVSWVHIADKFSPAEIVGARNELAEVVMNIARENSSDIGMMRDAAIRTMERHYPQHFKSSDAGQSEAGG